MIRFIGVWWALVGGRWAGRSFVISKDGLTGKRSWKGCGLLVLGSFLGSFCFFIMVELVLTPNPVTRIVTVSWSWAPVLPIVVIFESVAVWRKVPSSFFLECLSVGVGL